MSRIAEYNPLLAIKIPGIQDAIETKGLVVIVGPNSSGKTLLLKDIESQLTGVEQKFVVCLQMKLAKPADSHVFVDDLLAQKLMERRGTNIKIARPYFGKAGTSNADFQPEGIVNLLKAFNEGWAEGGKIDFFSSLGQVLLTSLFLENRLTLYTAQARFDHYSQMPQNDLQALFLNHEAQQKLETETGEVFGNAVWLDITQFNNLSLRASGSKEPTPYEERTDPSSATKYRLIDFEGHGLKSYAGIAIALLLGQRPVCLIDEPELGMHPPQARALGRFIGKYGTAEPHVTFVATHSSHCLRGIIEDSKQMTILRLTNIAGKFRGHLVNNEVLREAIRRPGTRTETVLDGIFSQAVAIVEAEGDRAVYQAAGEGIENDFAREVHFVPVHGTGGIAEICKFYRALHIPVAIMADLDVVTDNPKITLFLNQLTRPGEAEAILALCKEVEDSIRDIPPTISEHAVRNELEEIKALAESWEKRDDITVSKRLSALRNKVDRLHELKSKGVAAFEANSKLKENLEKIIERCRAIGLFLVPCGQLENWAPNLMTGVSKNNKAEWADEASRRIKEAPEKTGDIWDFVKSVVSFLYQQAVSTA